VPSCSTLLFFFHLLVKTSLIESYDFRRGQLLDLDALIPSEGKKGLGKMGPRGISAFCVGHISLSSSASFGKGSAGGLLGKGWDASCEDEASGSATPRYFSTLWPRSCTWCIVFLSSGERGLLFSKEKKKVVRGSVSCHQVGLRNST
jgi:hypothetical protein